MTGKFDHAGNESPRSGSSKQVSPVVWFAIVVAIVLIVTWFAMKP